MATQALISISLFLTLSRTSPLPRTLTHSTPDVVTKVKRHVEVESTAESELLVSLLVLLGLLLIGLIGRKVWECSRRGRQKKIDRFTSLANSKLAKCLQDDRLHFGGVDDAGTRTPGTLTPGETPSEGALADSLHEQADTQYRALYPEEYPPVQDAGSPGSSSSKSTRVESSPTKQGEPRMIVASEPHKNTDHQEAIEVLNKLLQDNGMKQPPSSSARALHGSTPEFLVQTSGKGGREVICSQVIEDPREQYIYELTYHFDIYPGSLSNYFGADLVSSRCIRFPSAKYPKVPAPPSNWATHVSKLITASAPTIKSPPPETSPSPYLSTVLPAS